MNNEAVSNIVSAFMLVLIVVGAATGLAVYLSQEQKTTQTTMGTIIDYGLEQFEITSASNTLSFHGFRNDVITTQGAGFLFNNPGISDVLLQDISIDGTHITTIDSAYGILVLQKNMFNYTLYNYTFDDNTLSFNATTYWNYWHLEQAWNEPFTASDTTPTPMTHMPIRLSDWIINDSVPSNVTARFTRTLADGTVKLTTPGDLLNGKPCHASYMWGSIWNSTLHNIKFILPRSSIAYVMFSTNLLNKLNIGPGSHTLEITSSLGRSYSTTFTYYP